MSREHNEFRVRMITQRAAPARTSGQEWHSHHRVSEPQFGYECIRNIGPRPYACCMLIGYARVAKADSDTSWQIEALKSEGVAEEDVYFDQGVSGLSRNRPGLRDALERSSAGDELVVFDLDRLGRNASGVREVLDKLERRGVTLRLIRGTVPTDWQKLDLDS